MRKGTPGVFAQVGMQPLEHGKNVVASTVLS